ncbi:MAG TPA: alanine racemase [Candidatus Polarisedimenticolaceae bacterium]|nr:alanine racemase [Candidatus Polarisedimenticolaceae bacterium]
MLNWVEVDAAALTNNVAEFRRRLGTGPKFGAVVKSNAYGHGMREVAGIVESAGADWLCVNNIDEGVALRATGTKLPILIMGYVELASLHAVVENQLDPIVYNDETLDKLEALAAAARKKIGVHVKVETGTHRQGVLERDVPAFVKRIQKSNALTLAGVSTHFANIEDTTDHGFAEQQIAAYTRILESISVIGAWPLLRHSACSAAVLLFNRTHLDLARVGISLYGLWPSKETYVSCLERGKASLDLKPVLTWKTRIAQVKDVPEGGYVGYGLTWRATRPTRIAVLPVGYYEGFNRELSGLAHVLVRGKRAPIRGRICMNMCMVDVTDIPSASLEDEVVLLGKQGDEKLTAEQLAAWCGTISYEIVSRIHPSLPRVLVGQ